MWVLSISFHFKHSIELILQIEHIVAQQICKQPNPQLRYVTFIFHSFRKYFNGYRETQNHVFK